MQSRAGQRKPKQGSAALGRLAQGKSGQRNSRVTAERAEKGSPGQGSGTKIAGPRKKNNDKAGQGRSGQASTLQVIAGQSKTLRAKLSQGQRMARQGEEVQAGRAARGKAG